VLADVSFDILAGEIIGTIGPNGAGKTTLLEAVAGILPIDKGDVCWRGKPLPTARRREAMFYLPDGVRPYQDQPVTRVLTFFADVYRRSTNEVEDTVESVGLTSVLRKRVYSLSKGYGRRLMLALGLLTPHPLLLMDEPFSALDELTRAQLQDDLLQLWNRERKTVLFVTHNISEAIYLADRVVVMSPHPGRIKTILSPGLSRPRSEEMHESAEFMNWTRTARAALKS